MRIILIANPTAGRRKRHHLDDAIAYLREHGSQVELRETRKRGDALELARQAVLDKADAIVAAGGDGTINEVVNGMAYSGIPLGVLPMGTANVFALELGLPKDATEAAKVILGGHSETIHLGKADEHYFLQMAGVGFDAQVVYELDLGLKKRMGKLAYVKTALGVLMNPPQDLLEIVVDGEKLEGYGAIIGNGRYYGGTFQVTPLAGHNKPELDVCIFNRQGSRPMLRAIAGIASGKQPAASDVTYRKGGSISITSTGTSRVQADGEHMGKLPMNFTVAENALTILRPH